MEGCGLFKLEFIAVILSLLAACFARQMLLFNDWLPEAEFYLEFDLGINFFDFDAEAFYEVKR